MIGSPAIPENFYRIAPNAQTLNLKSGYISGTFVSFALSYGAGVRGHPGNPGAHHGIGILAVAD
jgi:hypothetical protein